LYALGTKLNTETNSQTIKLLSNDRVVPPKNLFNCEVVKKSGFLGSDKKCHLFIGITHIIIAKDANFEGIMHLFPLDSDCMTLTRTKESGILAINTSNGKFLFKVDEENFEKIFDLYSKIIHNKINLPNIINSLPYNKRDTNVAKIVKDRMREIDDKIEQTRRYLEELYDERRQLAEKLTLEDDKGFSLANSSKISRKHSPIDQKSSLRSHGAKRGKLSRSPSPNSDNTETKSRASSRGKEFLDMMAKKEFERRSSEYTNKTGKSHIEEVKFASHSSNPQDGKAMKTNSTEDNVLETSLEELDAMVMKKKKRHTFGLIPELDELSNSAFSTKSGKNSKVGEASKG